MLSLRRRTWESRPPLADIGSEIARAIPATDLMEPTLEPSGRAMSANLCQIRPIPGRWLPIPVAEICQAITATPRRRRRVEVT
jgi:hypothetical protein